MKLYKSNFFVNHIFSFILFFIVLICTYRCKIQCMEGIEFFCEENQTCCMGLYGWRCLDIYKGNCCIDGLKACKQNTFCDPKSNKCVKIEK